VHVIKNVRKNWSRNAMLSFDLIKIIIFMAYEREIGLKFFKNSRWFKFLEKFNF
jgi:hypothetical protein